MGRELTRRYGILDVKKMRRETAKLMSETMGFTSSAITPESSVKHMSGGERQGVAITRALYFQAELIILDEPCGTNPLQRFAPSATSSTWISFQPARF